MRSSNADLPRRPGSYGSSTFPEVRACCHTFAHERRIREEELTVILRRLLAIRITPGTFPAADDSSPFASALQSHPLAHLFRFMPQLVALAGLPKPTLPLPVQYRGAFEGSLPAGITPGRISKDEVLPRPIETAATVPQLSRHALAALATVLSV